MAFGTDMIERPSSGPDTPPKPEPAVLKSFKAAMERAGDDPKKLEVIAEYLQNYEQAMLPDATKEQKDRLAYMKHELQEAQGIQTVVGKMIAKAEMPAGPAEPPVVTDELSAEQAEQMIAEQQFAKEAPARTAKAIREQQAANTARDVMFTNDLYQEGASELKPHEFLTKEQKAADELAEEARGIARALMAEDELEVMERVELNKTLLAMEGTLNQVMEQFSALKAKLQKHKN